MVIFFMFHLNVEIKARCTDPSFIRNYLIEHGADFKGLDEQTDTYFNVSNGRLKLREGNIENNLIFYDRNDQPGPKSSHFHLVKIEDAKGLREVLERSCGVKMIVGKRREIYYIDNVKFHIDNVPALGWFVEIEAGNILANKTKEALSEQCNFYLKEFRIKEEDLIEGSYSDMLAKVNSLFDNYST
ncbi:MAG TPA: class IV adenylate cyclase [Chitinophagaceae bacterium]|nr:class IV adenylate cyclase [Chitinophagaceae bacterium]